MVPHSFSFFLAIPGKREDEQTSPYGRYCKAFGPAKRPYLQSLSEGMLDVTCHSLELAKGWLKNVTGGRVLALAARCLSEKAARSRVFVKHLIMPAHVCVNIGIRC